MNFGITQEEKRIARALIQGASLVLGATIAGAQSVPVVTGDTRVDKLLSQMSLQEKLTLIHGTHEDPAVYQGQAGYLAAYTASLDKDIAEGYLLSADRAELLAQAMQVQIPA